jgi:molybdopterin-containing oxidoreductase family iron-sulfur binding subunit
MDVKSEERRKFLSDVAKVAFAGIIAAPVITSPFVEKSSSLLLQLGSTTQQNSDDTSQQTIQIAQIPNLPEAINGEDPIIRMMEDLHRALQKPMEQRRWGMVIDLRKCTGCQACTIACIQENKLPPGVVYRPVITETHGTFPNVSKTFTPRPCMQCDNPPCVPVCPVGATYKRADGIVVIDYDVCIGCRYCITACPYQARTFDFGEYYGPNDYGTSEPLTFEQVPSLEYGEIWNREDGKSPIHNARKCHFCTQRIEQGLLPACVLSCMGRATYFGDLNDPNSLVSELAALPNASRLKEDLGTQPKVYYLT